MKWSWKIARIAGIDVSVHATFFLLLLWFALVSWRQSQELVAVFTSLAFIVTLFACVVMHEFGHALMARRFGISTRSITLLPIGGVAALEKMPDDPKQEILVALAGPAVNVVIAGVLWLYLSATMTPLTAEDVMAGRIPFWYQIMVVNIVLAVFNLLPAFPMDGGRVLRAALALFMPHNEATQKAARIGQSLAFVLAILGILYNPWLILIAAFIWLTASAEANMEEMQTSLLHVHAGDAMITDFVLLDADDSLQRAIDATLQTSQKDYPVAEAGQPRYLLSQAQLLEALQQHAPGQRIGTLDLPSLVMVDAGESMEAIFRRLQGADSPPLLAVQQQGRLAGIVNLDNIVELIRIDKAQRARRAGGRLPM